MANRRYAAIGSLVIGLSAAQAVAQTAPPPAPATPITTKCESPPLIAAFALFGETGRMPPDLGRFLADAALQRIEPYKAFDNVYYVGICWVSAWLITSPNGHVLIDTLYGPFTDQLLTNIRAVGFDPMDIKLVVVTHGHSDHAGGMAKLKATLSSGTRFAMTEEGWAEGNEAALQSVASGRNPWTMIERDVVVQDAQTIKGGDIAIQTYKTPGHTFGTASFAFDVLDGSKTYRAFTVGGLGLNAIKGPEQVEAFIGSVKRIRTLTESGSQPVDLHLTTHPFSNGLTEAKDLIKSRKPGDPHPLVDRAGFRLQLDALQAGAEKRLIVEQKKKAN
ncbi:metallo-hydrolase-like_MBL-fold domain containing protein [Rhabdaerophilaceae bacterium]